MARVLVGIAIGLALAVILRQGIVHHWRLSPVQGTWDCRTSSDVDDGCSMFGTCLKCGYACLPGTEPTPDDAAGSCS